MKNPEFTDKTGLVATRTGSGYRAHRVRPDIERTVCGRHRVDDLDPDLEVPPLIQECGVCRTGGHFQ